MSEPVRHEIEPLIDADQAAEILGMSADWVYQEAVADRLPSYKIGSRRKFRASELERFIEAQRSGTLAVVHDLETRRR